jgi:hypothetical protein
VEGVRQDEADGQQVDQGHEQQASLVLGPMLRFFYFPPKKWIKMAISIQTVANY